MPFAFTEHGVAQLSSVLNSDIAIEINIQIIRAFIAVRQMIINPPIDKFTELQQEVKELKVYIEEVFADYNDINDACPYAARANQPDPGGIANTKDTVG